LSFSRQYACFPSCRPQDSLPIRIRNLAPLPWVQIAEVAHLDEVGSGAIVTNDSTALRFRQVVVEKLQAKAAAALIA
jgi:hypothetical protein